SLGRSATEPEIAKALDIDLSEYRQVLLDTNNSQLFSYDEWHEVHGESCEPSMDEDDGGNPLSLLMESSLKDQIVAAIDQLPEREKMVLTLYYQEELNLKEIGAVLEVGES
ncbi:sigma factor-like helix-turn-helix DNA-binding protein, partial [Escherichia coli]